MASTPGILTDWPWKPLGSFKYVVIVPWAVHATYTFVTEGKDKRDLGYFLIFPFMLFRMLHNQLWISLSRYRTAKGSKRIVDRGLEFEQVDRESNWDDQILLNGLVFYIGMKIIPQASRMPIWRTDGAVLSALLHIGPVEFLYYWLHRALHHHFLYSRYHSHHHSSIVTEPITSVIHPFAEHVAYFLLFAIPMLTTTLTGTASIISVTVYVTFIDFMNNMGHCNFELVPGWLFSVFPPLKYIFYTPSYHSLHHTHFRTNYALFMPVYDYIYGTVDESSDALYETTLRRGDESPDVVHLTHLTTPDSLYQIRLGFSSVASNPYKPKWYIYLLRPLTFFCVIFTWTCGQTFVLERNTFKKLKLQSWLVPRFNVQYMMHWRRDAINGLIEAAILDADNKGVKVLSLGLLNQEEELNGNGERYIQKYPHLKLKIIDGTSLAAAVVINSIPKGTEQVLLRGRLSKLAFAIADALCQKGIQVVTPYKEEYAMLKTKLAAMTRGNVVLSQDYSSEVWIVGDGWAAEEQFNAAKGTIFIPFSQFPPRKLRKDCFFHTTPAMVAPSSFDNMHSCENWLPRRVMSAWRVAGIVHALEGWSGHDCGQTTVVSTEEVWRASLKHGFHPLPLPV